MTFRRFATCVLFFTATIGCGGNEEKKTTQSNQKEKAETSTTGSNKPARVESKLPFKDLDVATASKGIDPGRLLIDVKGQDSAGKDLALSDYKGKVILLDTWASW